MISASLRFVFTIRVVARTEAVATFASYRYILYHNLCYCHSRVSQGEYLRAKKMYIVTIFPVQEWDQIHSFPSKSASPAPLSLSVVLKPATFSSSALPAPFSCHLSLSICFTVIHAPPHPPHPLPRPPTHPATQPNLILYIPLPYILRECGRRPDEELGSCDLSSAAPSVKTFIRGRTHHLHSDYNDPRGHAGRGCV